MDFFKKIFKHKITIQEVLLSLENFSNDVKSLNNFTNLASQYFGANWKFNIEIYINTLPTEEKEKYYTLFKNVLEYERALSLWTSATQIIKGLRPVSADDLKEINSYEKYLSKFGIEGIRLFEKLKSLLDLKGNETTAIITISNPVEKTSEARKEREYETAISHDDSEITSSFEDNQIHQDYSKKLRQKILQKVKDIELKAHKNKLENTNQHENNFQIEEDGAMPLPTDNIVATDSFSIETSEPKTQNVQPNFTKVKDEALISFDADNTSDWILKNFVKINTFISQLREVMSAISLYKNSSSLEEYKYYGFLIDTTQYMIEKGQEILSTKSTAEISSYFEGGVDELKNIISSYKEQMNNEIIFSDEDLKANPSENKG